MLNNFARKKRIRLITSCWCDYETFSFKKRKQLLQESSNCELSLNSWAPAFCDCQLINDAVPRKRNWRLERNIKEVGANIKRNDKNGGKRIKDIELEDWISPSFFGICLFSIIFFSLLSGWVVEMLCRRHSLVKHKVQLNWELHNWKKIHHRH
jgi:hypothetical protein